MVISFVEALFPSVLTIPSSVHGIYPEFERFESKHLFPSVQGI